MENIGNLKTGSDALFILLGAIMVLAMHAGFAFLELGTVRKKNQVNALVKILTDFGISTLAYFFIGYGIAYGVNFFTDAERALPKTSWCPPCAITRNMALPSMPEAPSTRILMLSSPVRKPLP